MEITCNECLRNTLSLSLSLFIVNIEGTIISTSLFAITSDLESFEQTSWIVTSYLITYTGQQCIMR
ncbi:major facilitator superfamily domain-containing protein [Penicillium macrosclerotiorum]|uniref:major facilitator superfamily domain-containing protein n=1 Tax=Penicillium macrosclerotiorum TaxID=303699 RepID=UPI00254943E3|nr:major facilitator superfamily domain-containing protein [Penicillium macrosclerotiorum]KAJ5669020.1 major facilitator superfamily domain-containing protein [Penicillium macrosclerotiorum]